MTIFNQYINILDDFIENSDLKFLERRDQLIKGFIIILDLKTLKQSLQKEILWINI